MTYDADHPGREHYGERVRHRYRSELNKSRMVAQEAVSTPSLGRHASQGWVAFWWDSGWSLPTGLHLHIPSAGAPTPGPGL